MEKSKMHQFNNRYLVTRVLLIFLVVCYLLFVISNRTYAVNEKKTIPILLLHLFGFNDRHRVQESLGNNNEKNITECLSNLYITRGHLIDHVSDMHWDEGKKEAGFSLLWCRSRLSYGRTLLERPYYNYLRDLNLNVKKIEDYQSVAEKSGIKRYNQIVDCQHKEIKRLLIQVFMNYFKEINKHVACKVNEKWFDTLYQSLDIKTKMNSLTKTGCTPLIFQQDLPASSINKGSTSASLPSEFADRVNDDFSMNNAFKHIEDSAKNSATNNRYNISNGFFQSAVINSDLDTSSANTSFLDDVNSRKRQVNNGKGKFKVQTVKTQQDEGFQQLAGEDVSYDENAHFFSNQSGKSKITRKKTGKQYRTNNFQGIIDRFELQNKNNGQDTQRWANEHKDQSTEATSMLDSILVHRRCADNTITNVNDCSHSGSL